MEAEHATALQAAQARSRQAGDEVLQAKESQTAQVAALKASHAEALQHQKITLEQQLAVHSPLSLVQCTSCTTVVYLAPAGRM